jgi:hypothetical protein
MPSTQPHMNGVAHAPPPPSGGNKSTTSRPKRRTPKKKPLLKNTVTELAWLWRLLAGVGGAVLLLLSIAGIGWAGKALYEDRAPVAVVQQLEDLREEVDDQSRSLDRIETDISTIKENLLITK